VIGSYLQYAAATRGTAAAVFQGEYEQFAERARNLTQGLVELGEERPPAQRVDQISGEHVKSFDVFSFKDLAQHLSSGILSLFVLLWGMQFLIVPIQGGNDRSLPFIAAGALGIVLSWLAYLSYNRRLKALQGLVEMLKREYIERQPA
jgi:hypothetical protein